MIRILKQGEIPDAEILARTLPQTAVADTVAEILAAVRAEGDAALRRFCAQFDGGAPESLRVTEAEMEEGLAAVEPE
ncbi:MAG: histidinol dehydrogenase, partial [Oscillospiraceae bacterium]|nr:histidinol dehydrogenase [Oscillospiraceae bacterium]